jgi:hypothetical protein
MLYKAHRCRTGKDLYNSESEILKTLCRPYGSDRVRDIRPEGGDEVKSIWEEMCASKTRFFFGGMDDIARQQKEFLSNEVEDVETSPVNNPFPRSLLYNDADVLEDAILFPEELQQKTLDSSVIGNVEPLKKWEEEGFSLRKFAEGLDLVDSDLDTEDEESDLDTEDEESEWETDSNEANSEDDASSTHVTKMDHPDVENDPHKRSHEARSGHTRETGKQVADRLGDSVMFKKQMVLMKKIFAKPSDTRDKGDHGRMHDEFMRYLDKEKARSKSP